jgi:hypothetical protein
MEEIENIKRLLLSEDSKELGLELAKSLNLVNEVVRDLRLEIINRMEKRKKYFDFAKNYNSYYRLYDEAKKREDLIKELKIK